MKSIPARYRTAGPAAAAAVSLAAILAACGGGSSPKAASTSNTTAGSSSAGAPAGAPSGGGFPGVFGSVAALSGSSMEVQNPQSGQTTVNWTASTNFDQTVTLTATALAAGECVTVTGPASNGQITARSVAVSSPSASGACTGGFGAGRRAAGSGTPGSFPTGRSVPTGGSLPGGGGRGGRFGAGGGFANGKVVSASATSLVIYGTSFTGTGTASGSTPPSTAAPADITVALTSSTVFTQQKPATAANLAVGDCVTANGSTDSTGAVTARTVRITSTGGQSCTAGFGRFGGGGAGGGGAGAGGPAGSTTNG